MISEFEFIKLTPKNIIALCKINTFLYHTMDDEMKATPGLFEKILPKEFSALGQDVRSNVELCKKVVQYGDNYNIMSPDIQKQVQQELLAHAPSKFSGSCPELFDDPQIVMNASIKCVHNISYSPFKYDQKFVHQVLRERQKEEKPMTEHFFKCATSCIKHPGRHIIKIHCETGFKFTKKSKIRLCFLKQTHYNPPMWKVDSEFVTGAENRMFTLLLCLTKMNSGSYAKISNLFESMKFMEYLN